MWFNSMANGSGDRDRDKNRDRDRDKVGNRNRDRDKGKAKSLYTLLHTPCSYITKAEKETEIEADYYDLTAQGFLCLLQQFHIILFQDLVIIKQEFLAYPLW